MTREDESQLKENQSREQLQASLGSDNGEAITHALESLVEMIETSKSITSAEIIEDLSILVLNENEEMTIHLEDAIEVLQIVCTQSIREHGELPDADHIAIATFFNNMRDMVQKQRSEDTIDRTLGRTAELVKDIPTFEDLAYPYMEEAIASSGLSNKNIFDSLRSFSTTEHVVSAIARKLNEDNTFNTTFRIPTMLRIIDEKYTDKGETTLDLEITTSLTDSLKNVAHLCAERGQGALVARAVRNFVARHPELSIDTTTLIQNGSEDLTSIVVQTVPTEYVIGSANAATELANIINNVPTYELEQIVAELQEMPPDNRMGVIRQVFGTLGTKDIDEPDRQEMADFFRTPAGIKLLNIMADDPWTFRYELGRILSTIDFEDIQAEARAKLAPALVQGDYKVQAGRNGWYLCDASEFRLIDSMTESTLVIADERILVKTFGRTVGLCLETFTTADGTTLIAGNWYQPIEETRSEIDDAFDSGTSHIHTTKSKWVLMRPLKNSAISEDLFEPECTELDILSMSRKYVETVPDSFPTEIRGMTRHEYRKWLNNYKANAESTS